MAKTCLSLLNRGPQILAEKYFSISIFISQKEARTSFHKLPLSEQTLNQRHLRKAICHQLVGQEPLLTSWRNSTFYPGNCDLKDWELYICRWSAIYHCAGKSGEKSAFPEQHVALKSFCSKTPFSGSQAVRRSKLLVWGINQTFC